MSTWFLNQCSFSLNALSSHGMPLKHEKYFFILKKIPFNFMFQLMLMFQSICYLKKKDTPIILKLMIVIFDLQSLQTQSCLSDC